MRIELTRRGDYAVRAAVVLARPDAAQMTAGSLAEATGIPGSYVPQVMGDLVRAGLVANRRGRSGGYRLAVDPREATLLSVIEAVEGDIRRRTCVLRGGPCGQLGSECAVHDAFAGAQAAAIDVFRRTSIADVASSRRRS